MRWLVLVVGLVLGLALAESGGGLGGLGNTIGDAIDAVSSDIVPKMLTFLGLLVSVSLGWAIVKVIRG
jgi:F0F1-type ATP synthase membrane subunit c/vacuolar-type H+-ATPase subunit K